MLDSVSSTEAWQDQNGAVLELVSQSEQGASRVGSPDLVHQIGAMTVAPTLLSGSSAWPEPYRGTRSTLAGY